MQYKEIKGLLSREILPELKPILDFFSESIDNAVNFGTNLLKWDIDKKLIGDEHIAPIMFLRNILEIADGISILVKSSSIDTCYPLQRSLTENVLGLKYLLESEETFKNRSLSYIVWLTQKDLKLCEKFDSTTQNGKQLQKEISKDKLVGDKYILKSNKHYEALKTISNGLLKLTQYQPINKEYLRTSKKTKNPNWYSLFSGPRNIESLAKHLELHATYEINYRYLSGKVHATDIIKKKIVQDKNNMASIIQIRDCDEAQGVTSNTLNFLLMAIIEYKKRIPQKSSDFKNWYSEFGKIFKEINKRKFFKVDKSLMPTTRNSMYR
ncbi:MAG: DUF5677 domain-containing protein [Polaribacter sp.]